MRKMPASAFSTSLFTASAAHRAALLALLVATGGLPGSLRAAPDVATAAAGPEPARINPFLAESILPYQLPPFNLIKDDDYAPAFELGMTAELKEVDDIAGNPEKATFDNTVVAVERSGQLLDRVER